MHVLFCHQNFPAQFRYLAPRLAEAYGWKCSFVTQQQNGTLPGVTKILYKARHGATAQNHFCTRNFENAFGHAHAMYEALKEHPNLAPDLVVAHSGFGSSLFTPFLYHAPVINFFELFYRPAGQDLGFRPEFAVEEPYLLRSKTRNAMMMLDLENCDAGWTPTRYQRDYFPPEYHHKIRVLFDGIDSAIYRRRENPERRLGPNFVVPPGKRVVTYAARGFERMRGFDVFMKVAKRIYQEFPDVLFIVVGADNVHYGPDLDYTTETSFRKQVLKEDNYDLSKFVFTGFVEEPALAAIMSLGDVHIYLTQPFIASWSMVSAMGCGAVVLASDQVSVREYIRHGENGLLADFFDVEGLAQQALRVLRDPAAARPLGEQAMRDVQDKYSVDAALPKVKAFFEEVAAKPRTDPLMKDLVREGTMKRVNKPQAPAPQAQAQARRVQRPQPPRPPMRRR